MRDLLWPGAITAAMGLLFACTSPPLQTYQISLGGGGSGGAQGAGGEELSFDAGLTTTPPPADAGGLCGNQIEEIVTDPPNVYFIFDLSGSMAQWVPDQSGTRYEVVQHHAWKIVDQLHVLIKAGAAVFPDPNGDSCAPGVEVFPPTFDDADGFNDATKHLQPNGGTPISATLDELHDTLAALPGETLVILATDGGPNCNPFALCDADGCQVNIEDACGTTEKCCANHENCCTAALAGAINCVDHSASVQAVKDLAAMGVKVAIIGIPGSQVYVDVLVDMAITGGVPVSAYPFYHKVTDLGTLSATLAKIAGSSISCDITLDAAPPDPNKTNVYFDQKVVPADPNDGWSWSAPNVVTLNGDSCDTLHSGEVGQVQVVSGCPTIGPR